MNTKKNLLGLAVLTTSLALVGCGGSSSSGNQQTDEDTTPDEPTFPAAFPFSQDPATALDEMKELPEKAFAEELYDFIKTQLIDGDQEVNSNPSNRFDFWVSTGEGDTTGRLQCGTSNFGTLAPSGGFAGSNSENTILLFDVGNVAAVEVASLGPNADNNETSLWRSTVTIAFDDCQLPDADNPSTIIATLNGQVALERTWVGESNSREAGVTLENFSFNFTTFEGSSLTVKNLSGVDFSLSGSMIETQLYGELTSGQEQAISNLTDTQLAPTKFMRDRIVTNGFNYLYSFDSPDLKITATPNGSTPSQVKINNFASVLSLKPDPINAGLFDYELAVEANYRGDENSEQTSIVFGTGESEQSLFLETRKQGSTDGFIAGTADINSLRGLLRDRSTSVEDFSCPDGYSLGYSATSEAPLVAGLVFLDNANDENTLRVFVNGDNEQTSRDPSVAISTMSFDADCSPGNGPTHFIPLPGLGGVEYTTISQPPQV